MPRHLLLFLLLPFLFTKCTNTATVESGNLDIIPMPTTLQAKEGSFDFSGKTKLSVSDEQLLPVLELWLEAFNAQSGWDLVASTGENGSGIGIQLDPGLEEEGYTLTVNTTQIQITVGSPAGALYALQTLEQMLPVSYFAGDAAGKMYQIPSVEIQDQPRFAWRGFMLDVSRHFFTVEQVKEVLDFMAELKLNRFHWHLADDQGWRVEVKQYPKLTEVGAWRVDHTNYDENISDWWGRPVQTASQAATYGGFYTQEEIKEVV
ncbi:MAG: family 20 glycosylhydrolase, partial [Bacteroidota bacterium]